MVKMAKPPEKPGSAASALDRDLAAAAYRKVMQGQEPSARERSALEAVREGPGGGPAVAVLPLDPQAALAGNERPAGQGDQRAGGPLRAAARGPDDRPAEAGQGAP